MKKSFSTNELAGLLNTNHMWVVRQSKKENWIAIPRKERGGGNLWQLSSMSKVTQESIKAKLIASLPLASTLVAPVGTVEIVEIEKSPITELIIKPFMKERFTQKQEQVRDARLYILSIVEEMGKDLGINKAETLFTSFAIAGKLDVQTESFLVLANAKNRKISPVTLRQWRTQKNKHGATALIPKSKKRIDTLFPAWLPSMLDEFRKPSKPSIAQCYEALQKEGVELPTLRTVQRLMKNLGSVELQRGRMLPREHKKLTAFVRRDFTKLLPADVYTADGHTVDMYVLHPVHGKPFRPEITSVIDVATRACVGWSVSLNENGWGVADAIRMAVQNFGIPAIFYTDNGSGFKNKMLEAHNTGMLVRLGITPQHSLPYASQARGVIERFQQVFIRGTREFVGYAGKDMDKEALQLVYKLAQKEIKNTGTTRKIINWEQFLAWAYSQVADYNNRVHSTLKESPRSRWERLAQHVDFIKPSQDELDDLFKPYELRTVARCEVRIFNSIYFSLNLENYHGEQVRVGYDIHNPSQVWLRDMEGRFITTAELNGNQQDYFPMSVMEKARETRLKGKLDRLETHKQTALEEYHGLPIIETVELTEKQKAVQESLVIEYENLKEPKLVIVEDTKEYRFEQAKLLEKAIKRGENIGQENTRKLEIYKKTPEYESMNYMHEAFGDKLFMYA